MNKWEKRRSTQDTCNRFENETTKLYIYKYIHDEQYFTQQNCGVDAGFLYSSEAEPTSTAKDELGQNKKKNVVYFLSFHLFCTHTYTHTTYIANIYSVHFVFL